jgi:hypothetical protein
MFEETSAIAMAVARVTKEPVPPSQRVDRAIESQVEQLVLCEHVPPSSATAPDLA